MGQAAVHPPALVVLSHVVPNAAESIAWIGKGIVYDSGGLSIKSKVSWKYNVGLFILSNHH